MDFFDHQEVARRNTRRLVVLFSAAVLAIIAVVYLALVASLHLHASGQSLEYGTSPPTFSLWDWRLAVGTAVGVLLVVGMGSGYRTAQLASGGRAVAELLGGRRVEPGSGDLLERKLLNVVEEMSIASGTPVPPVYVLEEEEAINAFAAGFSPGDAVVGVTRGAMEKLGRDEVQGVVGHEFSHILNGDMRLNVRLMGVIHGILVLGTIGYFLLRVVGRSSRGRSRSDRGGGAAAAILAFGAALWVIGSVGTFFGRLIRAGVSRQREFLADASSVQFTRNPEGITGALKKIGGLPAGSRLDDPRTRDVSHMLFGMGFDTALRAFFATHPPLAERIRRIDPSFDGKFAGVPDDLVVAPEPTPLAAVAPVAGAAPSAISQVGRPSEPHVLYARAVLERLPERVRGAAEDAYGARAVVYALLLDERDAPRRAQLAQLAEHADPMVLAETRRLAPEMRGLDDRLRLPALELALPALRELSPSQYTSFRDNVDALIEADELLEAFEWALRRLILHSLEPPRRREPRASLRASKQPVAILLGALAWAGSEDEADAQRDFEAGARRLSFDDLVLPHREDVALHAVDTALRELCALAPRPKRRLLDACAAAISADARITVREGELFRAVAACLDCPVPPLLPGQRLAGGAH